MRKVLKLAAALIAAAVILFAAAFLILGPERLWARFGPAASGMLNGGRLRARYPVV